MPKLSDFLEVAEDTRALTVTLSGSSRALLFSALASISRLWEWRGEADLTTADIDTIEALIAGATDELQIEADTMPIGAIIAYAGAVAPSGYRLCNGQILLQEFFPELFAMIGTTYNTGGEPANAFRLPNYGGRVVVGAGSGTGLTARTLLAQGGEETHLLLTAEMPTHSHTVGVADNTGGSGRSVRGGGMNVGNFNSGNAGGGGAHNNMQPFVALNFIIATGE